MTDQRTLIFAGNHDQARLFVQRSGLSPTKVIYVSDARQIMGLDRGSTLHLVGTWQMRNEAGEVVAYAKARGYNIVDEAQ